MDVTRILSPADEPASPVRWEPCAESHPDDGGPWCAACGWPLDDHRAERAAFAPPRAA